MSHRSTQFAGLSFVMLLCAVSAGQQVAAAEPSSAVVAKLDQDNDKTLDWSEVQKGASTRFNRLNKDHDGTLDAKEVKGLIGEATFKAADPDNDGTLSKDEYLALVKKLFQKADADNDGTLSAKELSSKAGRTLKQLID